MPLNSRWRAGRRLCGAALVLVVLLATRPVPPVAADSVPAPARMIVLMLMTYGSGAEAACTGFMIGPHTVATAGHCLNSPDDGPATNIRVIPGLNGLQAPYSAVTATGFATTNGWAQRFDNDYDFGVATLPSDALGNATGWFSFHIASDTELTSNTFDTAGYRGDQTFGTLWPTSGTIDSYDDFFLYFLWNTVHGNSGSPIWEQTATGYDVVGIVNGLLTSTATGATITDYGIRLTQPVIDQFTAALAAPSPAASAPALPIVFTVNAGQTATLTGSGWPLSAPDEVQTSTDDINWSTLQTGTTDANGNTHFVITPAQTAFYRTVALGALPDDGGRGVVTNSPAATTATTAPTAVPTGVPTGSLTSGSPPPASGGVALFVFGGGSDAQLLTATGCPINTAVFWVTDATGKFVPYVPGSTVSAVNAAWNAIFPAGIPTGTAMLGKCQ